MKLIQTRHKIRCELGVCKRYAEYTIAMERVGVGSRIHICKECLEQIYKLAGEIFVPKSIETAIKRKSKRCKTVAQNYELDGQETIENAYIQHQEYEKETSCDNCEKSFKCSKLGECM